MDLHRIASAAISAINPMIAAQYLASTGQTTNTAFKQVPSYAVAVTVNVQKQQTTFKDNQLLNNMSIGGITSTLYVEGAVESVDRFHAKGGDLFQFASETWLVVAVPEQWPDWCRVLVQLQVNGP